MSTLPSSSADPFAQMRRAIGSMSAAAAHNIPPRRGQPTKVDGVMGKTDILRTALAEGGRMRSEHLAPLANIAVTTVSALLRRDVLKGRIQCRAGWYSLNGGYDDELLKELAAATRLLRRHGFTVTRKARR